jgi:hypothetical protein
MLPSIDSGSDSGKIERIDSQLIIEGEKHGKNSQESPSDLDRCSFTGRSPVYL